MPNSNLPPTSSDQTGNNSLDRVEGTFLRILEIANRLSGSPQESRESSDESTEDTETYQHPNANLVPQLQRANNSGMHYPSRSSTNTKKGATNYGPHRKPDKQQRRHEKIFQRFLKDAGMRKVGLFPNKETGKDIFEFLHQRGILSNPRFSDNLDNGTLSQGIYGAHEQQCQHLLRNQQLKDRARIDQEYNSDGSDGGGDESDSDDDSSLSSISTPARGKNNLPTNPIDGYKYMDSNAINDKDTEVRSIGNRSIEFEDNNSPDTISSLRKKIKRNKPFLTTPELFIIEQPAKHFKDSLRLKLVKRSQFRPSLPNFEFKNNLSCVPRKYPQYLLTASVSEIYIVSIDSNTGLLDSKPLASFDSAPPYSTDRDIISAVWKANPHSVNFMKIATFLGSEVLILAIDNGRILIYETDDIVTKLRSYLEDKRKLAKLSVAERVKLGGTKAKLQVQPKFQLRAKSSVWGLDIHEKYSIIAVSDNSRSVALYYYSTEHGENKFYSVISPKLAHNIPDISFIQDNNSNAEIVGKVENYARALKPDEAAAELNITVQVAAGTIQGELVIFEFCMTKVSGPLNKEFESLPYAILGNDHGTKKVDHDIYESEPVSFRNNINLRMARYEQVVRPEEDSEHFDGLSTQEHDPGHFESGATAQAEQSQDESHNYEDLLEPTATLSNDFEEEELDMLDYSSDDVNVQESNLTLLSAVSRGQGQLIVSRNEPDFGAELETHRDLDVPQQELGSPEERNNGALSAEQHQTSQQDAQGMAPSARHEDDEHERAHTNLSRTVLLSRNGRPESASEDVHDDSYHDEGEYENEDDNDDEDNNDDENDNEDTEENDFFVDDENEDLHLDPEDRDDQPSIGGFESQRYYSSCQFKRVIFSTPIIKAKIQLKQAVWGVHSLKEEYFKEVSSLKALTGNQSLNDEGVIDKVAKQSRLLDVESDPVYTSDLGLASKFCYFNAPRLDLTRLIRRLRNHVGVDPGTLNLSEQLWISRRMDYTPAGAEVSQSFSTGKQINSNLLVKKQNMLDDTFDRISSLFDQYYNEKQKNRHKTHQSLNGLKYWEPKIKLNGQYLFTTTKSSAALFNCDQLVCNTSCQQLFKEDDSLDPFRGSLWNDYFTSGNRISFVQVVPELSCVVVASQIGLASVFRLTTHRGIYGFRQEFLFPDDADTLKKLYLGSDEPSLLTGLAVRYVKTHEDKGIFSDKANIYLIYKGGVHLTYEIKRDYDDNLIINYII